MPRNYLGIGCSQDAPAIALVGSNGDLLFAESTERFLQYKRGWLCPPILPFYTAKIVKEYGEPNADIVAVTSWSKSYLEWAAGVRRSTDDPSVADSLSRQAQMIERSFYATPDLGLSQVRTCFDHHLCHAAAGCYTAPFEECVCVVVDAWGEGRSHAVYHYNKGKFTELDCGPTAVDSSGLGPSLGIFYEVLCDLCGFNHLKGEEWKVMGLSAYGAMDRELYRVLSDTITVSGLRLLQGSHYQDLLQLSRGEGGLAQFARLSGTPTIEAANIAFTGQAVFAEKMDQLLTNVFGLGLSKNLVLSGGCALNSSYNGQVLANTGFDRLHVWCAPSDDGNAVGAAYLAYLADTPTVSVPPKNVSPYLGSSPSAEALKHLACFGGIKGSWIDEQELPAYVAALLAQGKVVGWVQGRAEFGPRALGNRSILADPRIPDIKDRLNARVKFREEFRPFAPAILAECGAEYFQHYQESLYMERTQKFHSAAISKVPGVVHKDGTGRVQSVSLELNPKFYQLIKAFYLKTGVPLILNTSFNVMGKPIIHTVEDAVAVFYTSGLDVLVIDNFVIDKSKVI
ncbi:MAG: carbamoyltransferase [Oligoflexia bacterium]|nr:carbamoyltransferase [Oligoflexia bacterium]